MIEPKEKAKELVEKYLPLSDDGGYYDDVCYNSGDDKEKNAKQCALIAVNEIIESLEHHSWQNRHWLGYYDEVKQEIEKL